jgi:transcriptional regulator with XRE-family HTH domain
VKAVSERFRNFRQSAGLTQPELAALLHVSSTSYISEIERGKREPGARLLKDFEILENSPTYKNRENDLAQSESLLVREDSPQPERWGPQQSMPPPHALPPEPARSITPAEPTLPHSEYAQAVNWLTLLFDKHPDAFRTAAAMIKGVVELVTKK